jgi:Histidine kinase-like ATPase domain
VTHNVSVMVVQAGAARQVLHGSPGEARAVLLAVEASGPGGPDRASSSARAAGPGRRATGRHPPQTSCSSPSRAWTGFGRSSTGVAAAGLPVELRVSGSPRALPPGLDLAAYRVVQEALTNVVKHARQAKTTVRLDYGPGELVIDVTDDGLPGIPAAAANRGAAPPGPGALPANTSPGPGAGRGLLGLRERVALYGGKFDTGLRPGAGGGSGPGSATTRCLSSRSALTWPTWRRGPRRRSDQHQPAAAGRSARHAAGRCG